MKFAAVEALLDANLEAATSRDSFQRTPLHWACMDVEGNHGDSHGCIIMMLLERASAAAHMVDIENRTPLHYLVARNNEIPLRLIAKMVALCPEALSMKDEVGEKPIDIVQSRKGEIRDVDELIRSLGKLETMFLTSATPDPTK